MNWLAEVFKEIGRWEHPTVVLVALVVLGAFGSMAHCSIEVAKAVTSPSAK